LPGSEEEKKTRTDRIQQSLRKATEPPLLTAETSLKIMEICREVVEKGNPSAVTDAAVGALLAHAALQGGALNVLVNLSSIKQSDYVDQLNQKVIFLQTTADKIRDEIMTVVKAKMALS